MGNTLIGSIGWGLSAIVTLVIAFLLIRAYLKSKENTLKYFIGFISARFFLFLSIALAPIIYALTKNSMAAGIFITLLYVFIFISLLFPPLLFTSFQWKKLRNHYFGLILILALAGIWVATTNYAPAIYFPETGVVFQPAPDILTKTLYPFAKILAIMPLAVLFLVYAARSAGKMRFRSLLIGLGFFWVITTIIVPTLIFPLWPWAAGMYCSIGDILIFVGVMSRIPKPEESPETQ